MNNRPTRKEILSAAKASATGLKSRGLTNKNPTVKSGSLTKNGCDDDPDKQLTSTGSKWEMYNQTCNCNFDTPLPLSAGRTSSISKDDFAHLIENEDEPLQDTIENILLGSKNYREKTCSAKISMTAQSSNIPKTVNIVYNEHSKENDDSYTRLL